MARFKRGDQVVIVDREVTLADRKSGLYYPHFAGLHGVVDQIYEEEGEICVEVDMESLPVDFVRRHQGIQEHVRKEWLQRLSEAERRSLPEEQKQLKLKYTVMVSPDDVAPAPRSRARKSEVQDAPAPAAVRRPTEEEIAAAEQAHIEEVARRAGQK